MTNDNKPFTRTRFWQEVYIAAIRAGNTAEYACVAANKALNDLMKLGDQVG